VLSAGQDFKKDAEGKPVAVQVVNLLVAPDQAEQLSLASHQTAIQLVPRNPLDRDMTKTKGVALEQLFGGGKPKPVEARARAVRSRPRRPAKPVMAEAAPPNPQPTPAPPVKKEEPFGMEILLGPRRIETTFGTR